MPIISFNTKSVVTAYALAQFVSKYLHIHRLELANNEIEIQEQLEEAILCGSTTQPDGIIHCRAEIRLITARKWLNRLGYKLKEVQKGVFYDRHERGDVVKSREKFLEEIKDLLPYFVEPSKDKLILPKEYLEDC